MSEYQYYEFRAIDKPLTSEQISDLRALSTRADITPTSFTNTYNYSDFRGDPRKLMESFFDAHVYYSNFGSAIFMLRLPRNVLQEDMLARYAVSNEGLERWTTDDHTILEWRLEGEPSGEWMEGEGWMGQLLPIRDELARGDYRSLYLGWLHYIANSYEVDDEEDYDGDELEEEEDDDEQEDSRTGFREPPVPAGLGSLTVSQTALAEFLEMDTDLIAAAAEASPNRAADETSEEKAAEWAALLPEQEVRALLVRILRGEGRQVQTELQSRYYRSGGKPMSEESGKRRTAKEIIARAEQVALERKKREEEERELTRKAHLEGLIPQFAELWASANTLAEEQKASSYDKVGKLMYEMREAYIYAGRQKEFNTQYARFLNRHSRRSSLVRKLKAYGLTS